MRAFLFRVFICVIVLGLVSVFAISTGAWPKIVEAVGVAFGHDAAEKVDDFGQASKDISEQISEAYTAAQNGEYTQINYPAIGELLDKLNPLKPGQRIPDYRRASFGEPWTDTDHNGCDTRNDILARDLIDITKQGECTVMTGTLADPYTGTTIAFQRGEKTSAAVQIDHVRSLSDAWSAGAWTWTDEQRLEYANDPMVLLAVDGPTNSSKSDKGPAAWMPTNAGYVCQYVSSYVAVSAKYNLAIADDDRVAIDRALEGCH